MSVQTIDAVPEIGLNGPWVSTPTLVTAAMGNLIGFSKDRTKLYLGEDKTLYVSSNDLVSRTTVFTFPDLVEGISFTDDGEAIVATQAASASPGYLYRSTGWNGLTATSWTKVFTTPGGYIRSVWANHRWSSYGSRVVTCEYGVQSQNDAATNSSYATRAYLSEDYGVTWRVILNLTTQFPGTVGFHCHAIAYDPYWDRIWVTYGDVATHLNNTGTNIMYSDDLGATWVTVPLPNGWSGQNSYPFQDTTIFVTEKAVGFMPDGVPYSPNILPRKGYRVMGDLLPGPIWAGKTGAQGISFCANKPWPVAGEPSPLLLTNQGLASQSPPGLVYLSPDGHGATWVEIYRVTGSSAADTIRYACGPTRQGKIFFRNGSSIYSCVLQKYIDDAGVTKPTQWAT